MVFLNFLYFFPLVFIRRRTRVLLISRQTVAVGRTFRGGRMYIIRTSHNGSISTHARAYILYLHTTDAPPPQPLEWRAPLPPTRLLLWRDEPMTRGLSPRQYSNNDNNDNINNTCYIHWPRFMRSSQSLDRSYEYAAWHCGGTRLFFVYPTDYYRTLSAGPAGLVRRRGFFRHAFS